MSETETTDYRTGFDEGYTLGTADGEAHGYRRGNEDGYENGWAKGFKASTDSFGGGELDKGYARGLAEGRRGNSAANKLGYQAGFAEGLRIGAVRNPWWLRIINRFA